jgi:beta-lactam-binding protein with PASTA domain
VRRFEGKTRAAAAATLARSHCRLGRMRRAHSKKVEKGHVIRPEPRFGAFWPDGPEVDLVLSLGPKR